MSVTTAADERLDEARDHLRSAYKAMLDVINPDTWGHHKFKTEAMEEFEEIAMEIMKLRRKLG